MPTISNISTFDRVRQFIESNSRLSRLAYFVFGALLTLTFAPFGFYFLMPILLLPAMIAWLYAPPRNSARLTFWYGAGLFLSGTYWLYISIHVFGQAPLWVALFIMLGLVLIMATYCAAAGWIISRLVQGEFARLLLVDGRRSLADGRGASWP